MNEAEQIAALKEIMRDAGDVTKLCDELRPYAFFNDAVEAWQLRHPWWYSVWPPLLPHECNKAYRMKREQIFEAAHERDFQQLLWLHERPYRMTLLERFWNHGRISVKQLRELLSMFWIDTEIPQGNQDEPMHLFREAGFVTDDQEGFDKLPEKLTLYRGVDFVFELTPEGPSWTRSRETAKFFAVRMAKGHLYTATVNKSDALAYFSGRGESEIILDWEDMDQSLIELDEDFSDGT
jgi:hypothetical protein